jgi:hypothetical protein
VQAISELHDQDPDVFGHRDNHLSHRLGLGRVAVFHPVEFGHTVDKHGHFVAEIRPQ